MVSVKDIMFLFENQRDKGYSNIKAAIIKYSDIIPMLKLLQEIISFQSAVSEQATAKFQTSYWKTQIQIGSTK